MLSKLAPIKTYDFAYKSYVLQFSGQRVDEAVGDLNSRHCESIIKQIIKQIHHGAGRWQHSGMTACLRACSRTLSLWWFSSSRDEINAWHWFRAFRMHDCGVEAYMSTWIELHCVKELIVAWLYVHMSRPKLLEYMYDNGGAHVNCTNVCVHAVWSGFSVEHFMLQYATCASVWLTSLGS